MTDYTESELARAWSPSHMPPGGPSHVHSIDRCEHEMTGREIHWLCGMHPVYTNPATARAMNEHIEVPGEPGRGYTPGSALAHFEELERDEVGEDHGDADR